MEILKNEDLMLIGTIIAFAIFCILMLLLIGAIFVNCYCYGTLRSFEAKTNNWKYLFLIFINCFIIWWLYLFFE